tara:strand:+ start:2801 stop:3829 length:1029 start_codon:yes stop_codon:yes gene_type:complete
MNTSAHKTSAELQREIDEERDRIGDKIDAIQNRLSPGQIIDELLTYGKKSGGAEYLNNLGNAVKTNPLPVALMGASMVWLMAQNGQTKSEPDADLPDAEVYPLYPVRGTVRRIGPPEGEGNSRYSHFSDESGKRLRALTDDAGHRAGHFVDEAGKTYRGFMDASGRQVDHILDEGGKALDTATGWASSTWRRIKSGAGHMGASASSAAGSAGDRMSSAGADMRQRSIEINDALMRQFRDQPLIGGALAFAVGAAIGAALPSTETEDSAVGETADKFKKDASNSFSKAVDKGSEVASEKFGAAANAASEGYQAARDEFKADQDPAKPGTTNPAGAGGGFSRTS